MSDEIPPAPAGFVDEDQVHPTPVNEPPAPDGFVDETPNTSAQPSGEPPAPAGFVDVDQVTPADRSLKAMASDALARAESVAGTAVGDVLHELGRQVNYHNGKDPDQEGNAFTDLGNQLKGEAAFKVGENPAFDYTPDPTSMGLAKARGLDAASGLLQSSSGLLGFAGGAALGAPAAPETLGTSSVAGGVTGATLAEDVYKSGIERLAGYGFKPAQEIMDAQANPNLGVTVPGVGKVTPNALASLAAVAPMAANTLKNLTSEWISTVAARGSTAAARSYATAKTALIGTTAVATGAAADAAQQEITTGNINPQEVGQSGLFGLALANPEGRSMFTGETPIQPRVVPDRAEDYYKASENAKNVTPITPAEQMAIDDKAGALPSDEDFNPKEPDEPQPQTENPPAVAGEQNEPAGGGDAQADSTPAAGEAPTSNGEEKPAEGQAEENQAPQGIEHDGVTFSPEVQKLDDNGKKVVGYIADGLRSNGITGRRIEVINDSDAPPIFTLPQSHPNSIFVNGATIGSLVALPPAQRQGLFDRVGHEEYAHQLVFQAVQENELVGGEAYEPTMLKVFSEMTPEARAKTATEYGNKLVGNDETDDDHLKVKIAEEHVRKLIQLREEAPHTELIYKPEGFQGIDRQTADLAANHPDAIKAAPTLHGLIVQAEAIDKSQRKPQPLFRDRNRASASNLRQDAGGAKEEHAALQSGEGSETGPNGQGSDVAVPGGNASASREAQDGNSILLRQSAASPLSPYERRFGPASRIPVASPLSVPKGKFIPSSEGGGIYKTSDGRTHKVDEDKRLSIDGQDYVLDEDDDLVAVKEGNDDQERYSSVVEPINKAAMAKAGEIYRIEKKDAQSLKGDEKYQKLVGGTNKALDAAQAVIEPMVKGLSDEDLDVIAESEIGAKKMAKATRPTKEKAAIESLSRSIGNMADLWMNETPAGSPLSEVSNASKTKGESKPGELADIQSTVDKALKDQGIKGIDVVMSTDRNAPAWADPKHEGKVFINPDVMKQGLSRLNPRQQQQWIGRAIAEEVYHNAQFQVESDWKKDGTLPEKMDAIYNEISPASRQKTLSSYGDDSIDPSKAMSGADKTNRTKLFVREHARRLLQSILDGNTTEDSWEKSPNFADYLQSLFDKIKAYFTAKMETHLGSYLRAIHDAVQAMKNAPTRQTDTPAFKEWFGDSKVVDEEGKPKVVVHGTTYGTPFLPETPQGESFTVFNRNHSGRAGVDAIGSWFTDEKQSGVYGATKIPTYLSIKKPYVIDLSKSDANSALTDRRKTEAEILKGAENLADKARYDRLAPKVGESGTRSLSPADRKFFEAYRQNFKNAIFTERERIEKSVGRDPLTRFMQEAQKHSQAGQLSSADGNAFRQHLLDSGYDGVILKNTIGDASSPKAEPADMYIALHPEQIKSATGNRGTFDPKNPDITASPLGDLVRNTNKVARTKLGDFFQKYLTPEGMLPREVFDEWHEAEGHKSAITMKANLALRDLHDGMKQLYKGRLPKGAELAREMGLINDALQGNGDFNGGPLEAPIRAMRNFIDNLSDELMRSGAVDSKLIPHIEANKGFYLTRSYQAFDDPNWFKKWEKKVGPDMANRAKSMVASWVAQDYMRPQMRGAIDAFRKAKIERFGQMSSAELAQQSGHPQTLTPDDYGAIHDALMEKGEAWTATPEGQERVKAAINQLVQRSPNGQLELFAGGKLGSKNLSILKRRTSISPEIRAMMGEYTDPKINFARSAGKMGALWQNHLFLNRVKELGMNKFLFEKPTGDHFVPIAAEGSATMAPLNGLHTTPEIAKAFSQFNAPQNLPFFLKALQRVNLFAKMGKTVLSPASIGHNAISQTSSWLLNGHAFAFNPANWREPISTLAEREGWTGIRNLMGASKDEARAYLDRMLSLGVLEPDARVGELKATMRDALSKGETMEGLSMLGSKTARILGATSKTHEIPNSFTKMLLFEAERARYAKALPDMPPNQLDALASHSVRDITPTYSQVPKAVRTLRGVPLAGPFISFASEAWRNYLKTYQMAYRDYQNPKTRGIAYQRLIGAMLYSSLFALAAKATASLLGIDSKEERKFRKFLPDWSKNSQIFWLANDGKGNLKYLDTSYITHSSLMDAPIQAILNGKDPTDALTGAFEALFKPALDPQIGTMALAQAAMNAKHNGSGGLEPVSTAPAGSIMSEKERLEYAAGQIQPGIIDSAERMYEASQGDVKKYGQQRTIQDELLRNAGLNVTSLNLAQSLRYAGLQYADEMNQAESRYRMVLTREGHVTPQELASAKNEMEATRQALFSDMADKVSAAQNLGLPTDKLNGALLDAGLKPGTGKATPTALTVKGLLGGTYLPYQITRPTAVKLDANAEEQGKGQGGKRLNDALTH